MCGGGRTIKVVEPTTLQLGFFKTEPWSLRVACGFHGDHGEIILWSRQGAIQIHVYLYLSAMTDRMVCQPSLSRDRKWTRVTKCTHSRVVGLRRQSSSVCFYSIFCDRRLNKNFSNDLCVYKVECMSRDRPNVGFGRKYSSHIRYTSSFGMVRVVIESRGLSQTAWEDKNNALTDWQIV